MSGHDERPGAERIRAELGAIEVGDSSDVLEAGIVTDLEVNDREVVLQLSAPDHDPAAEETLIERIRETVLAIPGVERVGLVTQGSPNSQSPGPHQSPDGTGHQTEQLLSEVETVIAVASAKGGVGKTTTAVWLARALAEEGNEVGLFDADIYGPNVPDLLDASGPVRANDEGDPVPVERAGMRVMSVGLLSNDGPLAWRGAVVHETLLQLLGDTEWDDTDTLVIDLPPGTGDVALTVLQSVAVDGAVLVTTPYPTSVSDTGRSATLFRENGVPVLGAVVNMDGFTCPDCGSTHDLFPADSPVADLDVPVLEALPFMQGVQNVGTRAVPDPMAELAATVGAALDDREPLDAPADAHDFSGLPEPIARAQMVEAFRSTDPGDSVYAVLDHDPRSFAEQLLVEEGGENGPDARSESIRTQRQGPDRWVLAIEKPSESHG